MANKSSRNRRTLEDAFKTPMAPVDYVAGVVDKVAPIKEANAALDALEKAGKALDGNNINGTWVIGSVLKLFNITKDYIKERVEKAAGILNGLVVEDLLGAGKKVVGLDKEEKKSKKGGGGGLSSSEGVSQETVSTLEPAPNQVAVDAAGKGLNALHNVGHALMPNGRPGHPQCNEQPQVQATLSKNIEGDKTASQGIPSPHAVSGKPAQTEAGR